MITGLWGYSKRKGLLIEPFKLFKRIKPFKRFK